MNRFYYSRKYIFEAPEGHGKHYLFNLVDRYGFKIILRLDDKDNAETVKVKVVNDGETEIAVFTFRGIKFSLRADRFVPKSYPKTPEGRIAKNDHKLKDAHIHTSYNRDEIEHSNVCYCMSCRRSYKSEEVMDYYADGGRTGFCPYCGVDAIIADSSGIKMSDNLLADLHRKYF